MAVKPRRVEHVADTRAALIDAARELFSAHGYAGASTVAIVDRARVTRGALYHHFRDKTDLFRAVMASVAADLAQRLVAEHLGKPQREHPTTWDELRAGLQTYLDAALDHDFQQIVLIDGPAVVGKHSWDTLVEQHGLGLLRDWLRQAIDQHEIEALPIEPLARLLTALISEASLYIARADDPATARAETGTTLDRMLAGLRPQVRQESPK